MIICIQLAKNNYLNQMINELPTAEMIQFTAIKFDNTMPTQKCILYTFIY